MTARNLLAILLLGVLAVVFFAWDRYTSAGKSGGGKGKRGAQLAARGDMRGLYVRAGRPAPGRIILGRHHGRLVAAGERSSCLIAGLTQFGYKTSGLMVPNVLQWDDGPVLAMSVKADVLRATIAQRRKVGEVKVFDPAEVYDGAEGERGTWSPIDATGGAWTLSNEVASALTQVGVEPTGVSSENEKHFRERAGQLLGPLLMAAYHGGCTMADVLAWIKRQEFDDPERFLQRSRVDGAREAANEIKFVVKAHDEYRMSVLQTLAHSLAAWQHPSVSHATGGASDITVDWLLGGSGRNSLYVIGTEKTQEVLAPLFGAMVGYLIGDALDRAERVHGGRLPRALLVGLDEVANTAPVAALDRYASAGASRGIQLITVVQNVSQLELRYGHAKAETILANHAAKLFCAGLNDPASLQYVEKVAGQQHVTRRSKHAPAGLLSSGARSMTEAEQLEPLVAPHQLRTAKEATALLVYGRTPPLWVDLRRYYLDRELRKLVPAALLT